MTVPEMSLILFKICILWHFNTILQLIVWHVDVIKGSMDGDSSSHSWHLAPRLLKLVIRGLMYIETHHITMIEIIHGCDVSPLYIVWHSYYVILCDERPLYLDRCTSVGSKILYDRTIRVALHFKSLFFVKK